MRIHDFNSKRGFTLTELVVSIAFAVLIFAVASYAWWAGNHSFQSSTHTSSAYSQARSLESLIQNAASDSSHLIFTDAPITYAAGQKYFQFYFENYTDSSGPYIATYFADDTSVSPRTVEFDAIDHVEGNIKSTGTKYMLSYRIESTDESGPFYIEGGIVLNNIRKSTFQTDNPDFPAATSVLNFEIDD